jgi:beta-glucuronidase
LLVIDETPAVSLGFTDGAETIEARRKQHAQALAEMMARDKNHPCVILWSVANEPGINLNAISEAETRAMTERGSDYFKPLFNYVRATDNTRPVVLVSVGSGPDEWVGLGDIICTNLYYGWYYGGLGQLDEVAAVALEKEIARLRSVHNKPIMLTEFGADTIAGVHAQPAEMWSEEYQADMMTMYMRVIRKHPYVIGSHPWAFADFRTSQGILRAAGLNHKGVFTRDRRPKLAAHRLRELWRA